MTESNLHLVRPFDGGLLLVTDRGTDELPQEVPAAPDFAAATRSALASNVLHAADGDGDEDPAVVTIDVMLGPAPAGAISYRAALKLPTGVLEIGDGERVDELSVGPGTFAVAVRASPSKDPDHVELWLERVG